MEQNIYLLSVRDEYVNMIIDGTKRWEFRKNPNFGISKNKIISRNDLLFLVSIMKGSIRPRIRCMCEILTILRNEEVISYFGEERSKKWREAGCREEGGRDWEFFKSNILYKFSTAIEVKSHEVIPAVSVEDIKKKTNGRSWSGKGFLDTDDLKNYSVCGQSVAEYFKSIANTIPPNPTLIFSRDEKAPLG